MRRTVVAALAVLCAGSVAEAQTAPVSFLSGGEVLARFERQAPRGEITLLIGPVERRREKRDARNDE